jgi:hypothetical protein
MKKYLILVGLAVLAYAYKDKIFGTSNTDDQAANTTSIKPGFNANGTPRLLTYKELDDYLVQNSWLEAYYNDNLGKSPNVPIGTSLRDWANQDWLVYGFNHNQLT